MSTFIYLIFMLVLDILFNTPFLFIYFLVGAILTVPIFISVKNIGPVNERRDGDLFALYLVQLFATMILIFDSDPRTFPMILPPIWLYIFLVGRYCKFLLNITGVQNNGFRFFFLTGILFNSFSLVPSFAMSVFCRQDLPEFPSTSYLKSVQHEIEDEFFGFLSTNVCLILIGILSVASIAGSFASIRFRSEA